MQHLVALHYGRRAQGAAMLTVALACLAHSPQAASAALLGGLIMALHFTLLLIVARYSLRQGPQGSLAITLALLLSKFFVMAAVTAAVLLVLRPHSTGFVLGLATFTVGMAGAAYGHLKTTTSHNNPHTSRF